MASQHSARALSNMMEVEMTFPLMVETTMAGADPAGDEAFWAVVPAGGSGTRLWPLSRSTHPKFLLPLLGDRSLLQRTADRLQGLASPERTLIVCGPAHCAPVSEQLPHFPATSFVVEPTPRGSGPAISLAAAIIARRDPEAVMGSFAADHDVRDEKAFTCAVRVAVEAAKADWLVTIGLPPVRPETGYGYIESTEEAIVTTVDGSAFRTMRFVEKPDLATARTYVESGRFLWNASMFIWKVRTFLDELAQLQPALHHGVTQIAAAWGTPEQEQVVAEVWPTLPEATIDQGVMERTPRVAVVPAEMGWSDVGDWHGLGTLLDHDADGMSARADLVHTRSRDSLVWSETNRVIALVGLENVVVVDTPDALLIVNRSEAQEVRSVVGTLTRALRSEVL
jgi:mannose-1-phosphate guanylyltransferase